MSDANLVLVGASFFLGKGLPQDMDYIVIKSDRIVDMGMDDSWKVHLGDNTKVIQLNKEQLVLPGFHDSHLHIIMSGMYEKYVDLGGAEDEEDAARMVKEFADTIPEEEWVIGLNWYYLAWKKKILPTAASIDRYLPDRPVCLINTEVHGAWVNSKALKVIGINKDSLNPPCGEIFRDDNGLPTGYLSEAAMGLVTSVALNFVPSLEKEIIRAFMKRANSVGITSVQDMRPELGIDLGKYETFHDLDENGELTVRIHGAANLFDDIQSVLDAQNKYNSRFFQIALLKQYIDGVSTNYTALVIDGYLNSPDQHGAALSDFKHVGKCIEKAQEHGLSVRLHSCGDGAVRQSLDFYENAHRKYGNAGSRHGIEHAEIIKPEDINRFQELGVIAAMQPEHINLSFEEFSQQPKYDDKQLTFGWAIKTLSDLGTTVAFGSDSPVVDLNPCLGLHRAVNRSDNNDKPDGGWKPEEKISIEQAIHAYTYNSAFAVKREHEIGTLEEGKYADIVVLDRNLLTINPKFIKDARVLMTIMNGKIVYQNMK
jgi:predicted amidohydrolase YtcJ